MRVRRSIIHSFIGGALRFVPGRGAAIVAVLLLAQPAPAWSAPPSDGALERIARTKTIRIGHRTDEPPFSYTADGRAVGYSIDLCLRIIDGLKERLQLDELQVVFVPVTTATRFLFVRDGGELECAATTNNGERRKMAEFSYPHFATATRFVALKRSGINSIDDLAGRSVSVVSGTVNIGQLSAMSLRRGLNISIVLRRQHERAMELVKRGEVSAFVMDDILLAGMIASSGNPSTFILSQDAFGQPEPYGIMMPPEDLPFKRTVNEILKAIFTSGEIEDIYARWFISPIPPNGVNMNFPMPQSLRAFFAEPREYQD